MSNDHHSNTENEYLGITEAAEYLRISASTLRRWEKKGFLVPERTPTGIRRYTKNQLDDVIQAPADMHSYSPIQSNNHGIVIENAVNPKNENIADLTPNTIPTDEETGTLQEKQVLHELKNTPNPNQAESITSTSDDEVDQLRDFFKRAGYDSVPTIESMQPLPLGVSKTLTSDLSDQNTSSLASENQVVAALKESTRSESFTSPEPFQALSLGDITHDTTETETSSSGLADLLSVKSNYSEILPINQDTFTPINTLPFKQPQRNRIEVFHEEQSMPNPIIEERNVHSQPDNNIRQSANVPHSDQVSNVSKENSYHVAPKEDLKKVNRLPIILVSVFLLVLVSVGGWFVFSAISAPEPLYSPIVD